VEDAGRRFPAAAAATPPPGVLVLASAGERAAAEAAREAAIASVPGRIAPPAARPIIIVTPEYERRATLTGGSLAQPWMSDVYRAILRDPLVSAAADRLARSPVQLVTAAGDSDGNLLLLLHEPAASLAAAAVIAAAWRATTVDAESEAREQSEPSRSPEEIAAWQRQPAATAPAGATPLAADSTGRWLWALAIALLGVEAVIRRRPQRVTSGEVPDVRVA
jgi:hypothetical protein